MHLGGVRIIIKLLILIVRKRTGVTITDKAWYNAVNKEYKTKRINPGKSNFHVIHLNPTLKFFSISHV